MSVIKRTCPNQNPSISSIAPWLHGKYVVILYWMLQDVYSFNDSKQMWQSVIFAGYYHYVSLKRVPFLLFEIIFFKWRRAAPYSVYAFKCKHFVKYRENRTMNRVEHAQPGVHYIFPEFLQKEGLKAFLRPWIPLLKYKSECPPTKHIRLFITKCAVARPHLMLVYASM